MLKQLNKDNKGFTIIEVLIVLAIAGLIMLIVFLAVPALQRNSRNTETRNEASRLLTTINEWITNNNGSMPGNGDVAEIQSSASLSRITTVTRTNSNHNGTVAPQNAVFRAPGTCSRDDLRGGSGRQVAVKFGLEPEGTTACISM